MTKEVQDFHLQLHRTGWSNHHPVRMHWIWLIWGDSAELKSSRMAGEPGAALPPATLSSTNSAKISQPARIPSQLALLSASERAACEQVQIGTRPWSVILELFRVAFQKKKKCPECPRAYINEIRNISLLGAHMHWKKIISRSKLYYCVSERANSCSLHGKSTNK